jgi:general secretion pathway protein I
MVASRLSAFRMKNKSAGLTLIEVLIALAIISIALTAVIKTTAQNIRDTLYLQNKMIAHWVGMNMMNQARAGLIKVSSGTENLEQETTMLGEKWTWIAYTSETPNPHVKEIHVEVSQSSSQKKLANLTGYLYAAP